MRCEGNTPHGCWVHLFDWRKISPGVLPNNIQSIAAQSPAQAPLVPQRVIYLTPGKRKTPPLGGEGPRWGLRGPHATSERQQWLQSLHKPSASPLDDLMGIGLKLRMGAKHFYPMGRPLKGACQNCRGNSMNGSELLFARRIIMRFRGHLKITKRQTPPLPPVSNGLLVGGEQSFAWGWGRGGPAWPKPPALLGRKMLLGEEAPYEGDRGPGGWKKKGPMWG